MWSNNLVYGQVIDDFACNLPVDTSALRNANRGVSNSENGYYLPTSGTIKLLIIFAEIQYSNSNFDPEPNGSVNWSIGALPSWADDLVDKTPLSTPQGILTKYYKQASSGNLTVLGDYLLAPTNNGVFKVLSNNFDVTKNELIATVNTAMNGSFLTSGGVTNPATFDNWSDGLIGEPKITPSTDSPRSYDHVMIIWRNHTRWSSGTGHMSGYSLGNLIGHPLDSWSEFGSTNGGFPALIARHELAHAFLGGNNFHSAGGGSQTDYWIPSAGGYGLLGGSNSNLLCWNGWDRYRLGWMASGNSFLISAKDVNGNEVNGDLDATNPSQGGTYILRDFVATGDAIRIKLPYLDGQTEYQQWLWLENHRGQSNNGNNFDHYIHDNNTSCVDPIEWGLTAAIQIDKETKTGTSGLIYGGYMGYVRQLSADGMWEREFDPELPDQCTGWNNPVRPATKLRENPLTGRSDLDWNAMDLDQDGKLMYGDQAPVSAENINGIDQYRLFYLGNPRQFFRTGENSTISMGTNPTSAARINQAGEDYITGTKNVHNIYLNGIKVKILDMLSNGAIKLKIDFDYVDINNDVTWMAPDIVLNEISNQSGYSLIVKSGNTLTLDHGAAATRMNTPISFEGNDVFTSPTIMHVKANANINIEAGSELVIDRKSTLSMEANSRIDIQNGAILRVKRDGILALQSGATINIMDGGKLIVENSDENYGFGTIKFAKDARINLEGPNALIDVNGLIDIGDNAVFRLSNQNNLNKTYGQIKFHGEFDNDVAITAGVNATIDLQGFTRNQLVVTNLKSNLEFPDNLSALFLKDMQIIQANGCRIITPFSNNCDIIFDNVDVSKTPSAINHAGIKLYGQAHVKIKNCSFNDGAIGISSDNFELGHSLSVSNSIFNNVQDAIITHGKGINLTEITFDQCDRCVVATNTSATSNIYKCEATNTVSSNITYEGATTLFVEKSKFYDAIHGISIEQGTLKSKCNEVHAHSGFAVKGSMNATLLMGLSFSNNQLNGNTRTFELDQVNILDLYKGSNDLRPISQGTQNIINGSLICSGSTTIDARKNKWKTGGGAPGPSDYSVYRSCTGFPSVTYTDVTPQSYSALCPSVIDPGPGALAGKNDLSDNMSQNNNYLNFGNDEGADEALSNLVESLRCHDIYDYMNSYSTESNSTQVTLSNIETNKLNVFNTLSEVIVAPFASDAISNSTYQNGISEIFSTFIELYSTPDSLSGLSDEILDEVFTKTLAVLDFGLEKFTGNTDYLFGLHLSKAQAYRIHGEYEPAIAEIAVAADIATNDSQIILTEKLDCLFNAESIMVANPGKDEWPEEYADCQYSNQESVPQQKSGGTQLIAQQTDLVEITAQPNPTSNSVVLVDDSNLDIATLAVYDSYGRKVLELNSNDARNIQMSELTNGIYFIRVQFEDGTIGQTKVLKSE